MLWQLLFCFRFERHKDGIYIRRVHPKKSKTVTVCVQNSCLSAFCYDGNHVFDNDCDIFAYHENGIEGTNVSISDLQELVFESFGPSAVLSENISFAILGDGAGFNSKVVVAENLWKSKDDAFLNKWPSSMAIKIATLVKKANSPTMDHDVAKLKRFYEVEIVVYRFLETHGNGMAIRMFGSESFEKRNKGILLLEFIPDASYLKLWEHISEPDLIKMIKEVAHLHAFTPRMDEAYFVDNGKVLNNIFFDRLSDEGVVSRLADAKEFLKDDAELYDRLEAFTEKLRPLSRKFYEKANELGLPKVFGHGDIWSGNVLYQKRLYKSLIDYQTCHFLHLGAEFGRMFAYMMGKNERRNFEMYMDLYLNELSRLWPENGITKQEVYYKVKSIVSDLLEEASDGLELILANDEF